MSRPGFRRLVLSSYVFLLATLSLTQAGVPAGAELVVLKNGINRVDLGGNVIEAMVLLAHRDNFNAHSFERSTFLIRTRAAESDPNQWQIVPFENAESGLHWKNDSEVSGGADCQLHTFRLFRVSKEHTIYVLIADRAPGTSLADSETVTFLYFKLIFNVDGLPGLPTAYFKLVQTETARKKYCDVNEAIKTELGLDGAIAAAK
jgi:hypothetical protein